MLGSPPNQDPGENIKVLDSSNHPSSNDFNFQVKISKAIYSLKKYGLYQIKN